MKSSQQVRRPLVGLALSMVLGLFVQQYLNLSAPLLLGLAACALALIAGFEKFRSDFRIYTAGLLLAAAYSAVESVPVPARTMLPVAEVASTQQQITGTVISDPKTFEADAVTEFRLKGDAVRFSGGWRLADLTVRVRCHRMQTPILYGERWWLKGRFRSYEKEYGGIAGAFYTDSTDAVRIQKPSWSFRGFCYQARQRAASVLRRGMEDFPEQTQLLLALLLGYRHELPDHLYQTFSRTGTLHIFAISGLHVGVMAAILIAVLKVLGISKPKWGWFLIPLLLFYVVSTGMKASAFRAFTMASAYFAAPLFHRRPDTVSAVSLASIILLAINPFQLREPGFLLSFTVVCGIIMVHHDAVRRFRGRIHPGRVVWARLGGPHPISVFSRTVGLLMLTSFAAWLFSIPLTAGFFNTLSPAALVGNLMIIPLAFMIVLTGCFSLSAALVFPASSMIFNHANRVFISVLMNVIECFGKVPGAYRFVRSPSVWVSVFWYAGLTLLFAVPVRYRKYGLIFVFCAVSFWISESKLMALQTGIAVNRDADFSVMISTNSVPKVVAVKGDLYSLRRAGRSLKKNGVNRLPVLAIADSKIDVEAVREICQMFEVECICLPQLLRNNSELPVRVRNETKVVFSDRVSLLSGNGEVLVTLQ